MEMAEICEMPQHKGNAMTTLFQTTLRIAEGGRIVIPAEVRAKLGFDVGTDIVLSMEEDRATLMNARDAARAGRRRAQALVAKYIPPGVSLSDELLKDRRAESARE
jgi:AbrB family looped-hinge helix DNA binding protein